MKASISFAELQNIIASQTKVGDKISLDAIDPKTIRVTYKLGFIPLHVDLKIDRIVGSDLYLSYSGKQLIDMVLPLIRKNPSLSFIEKRTDDGIIVHLSQIEQAKTVLEKIDVHDISVLSNAFEVDGILKI